jgi:hypothetical protein
MNTLFMEIVPSMSKEQREALITAVIQRMSALSQQQKRQNLEESLNAIRASLTTVFHGWSIGKLTIDDAVQLMGVAVAAALRNCSVSNAEQLRALVNGFNQWMMLVANECAPGVPGEAKEAIINKIWEQAATHF